MFSAGLGSLDTPGTVLIVKYENDRQLAAVERVDVDKFVLLRLSSSVRMGDVRKLAALAKKASAHDLSEIPLGQITFENLEDWWNAIKVGDKNIDVANANTNTTRSEPFPKAQMKLSEVLKSAKPPR